VVLVVCSLTLSIKLSFINDFLLQKAQVAIVDHHSASENFIKHMDNEVI